MIHENRHLDMEAIAAFEARCDGRDARRLARLKAEGYTYSVCSECGDCRTLDWAGGDCNNWADNDEQCCQGVYRAAGGAA